MPTYVYEVLAPDGSAKRTFEAVQSVRDTPLTAHPVSGEPVRRIIAGANIALKHTSVQENRSLSRENIERHGFTRYERGGDGSYVRTAGREGPDQLRP